MGIKDKLSGFFRAQEDEYDSFSPDEYDYYDEEEAEAPATTSYSKPTTDRSKVVNMRNAAQLQVVLVKPERFEDAPSIADHLNSKHTVVLNLEATNNDEATRLLDFLAGVAYSIDGQLKNIAVNTYIITPCNVDISDTQVRAAEAQQDFENQTASANLTSDTLF